MVNEAEAEQAKTEEPQTVEVEPVEQVKLEEEAVEQEVVGETVQIQVKEAKDGNLFDNMEVNQVPTQSTLDQLESGTEEEPVSLM